MQFTCINIYFVFSAHFLYVFRELREEVDRLRAKLAASNAANSEK